MSDFAEPDIPKMFDPEKALYEAGAIIMSEQERFIGEQTEHVVKAAEHILLVADAERRRLLQAPPLTNTESLRPNLLKLGAVVLGGIILNRLLDSHTDKKRRN